MKIILTQELYIQENYYINTGKLLIQYKNIHLFIKLKLNFTEIKNKAKQKQNDLFQSFYYLASYNAKSNYS